MVKELKQSEVEKFLKNEGWELVRVKGGHNVWKSPDGQTTIAIPRHGKTSPGVVRQVIKAVPNTPDNWR
jgi:predicted RNA binding protein YcfA (HicA-like mRNA interferase family)